jgi:hypothetical protein
MFYILNHETGLRISDEERASDLLAGGLMAKGYQCGMLWGASLAAGNYAYKQYTDMNQSICSAILISQNVINSFFKCSECINCRDFAKCNWKKPLSIAKYFVTGGFLKCMNLIANWAPDALDMIQQNNGSVSPGKATCLSCASEVIKKAGGTDKEAVLAAGFAGGIGLSGYGCGALGAAIWYKSLIWCRNNPNKTPPFFKNPEITSLMQQFSTLTNKQFECKTICGKTFVSPDDHSDFIGNGGCQKLICRLAELCRNR